MQGWNGFAIPEESCRKNDTYKTIIQEVIPEFGQTRLRDCPDEQLRKWWSEIGLITLSQLIP
jgi:hypothetical protein